METWSGGSGGRGSVFCYFVHYPYSIHHTKAVALQVANMRKIPSVIIFYLVLILGSAIMVFPYFWMISSAFKSPAEVATTPPTWIPSSFRLKNFGYVMETIPLGQYFINSLTTTIFCVSISTLTSILAAFAFSRLRFPGRDMVFSCCLALMMVPFEMLIITNYATLALWKLVDTRIALIIPFCASIFYTYILRNSFFAIPDSLYWSARTDGASNWKYLWRIMVPISRPTISTIILLNTITAWNSFIWPLLIINSRHNRTLPLGLYSFITDAGVLYERLMAASTLVVLPVIALFFMVRKQIVSGIASGGMKG
jgi:multiple sugar transport system permease protein